MSPGAVGELQYAGLPGITLSCQDAVLRLLQYGDRIETARILSCRQRHALLLSVRPGEIVVIKTGFASGYGGEGPRRFSYVLELLDAHGVAISEYSVSQGLLNRLDRSALRQSDVVKLETTRPTGGSRWRDYIWEAHWQQHWDHTLWAGEFPPVIPFAIVDPRIIELAISFWEAPDDRLLSAYRRLEDTLRERTGIDEHGTKLISRAFSGSAPELEWSGISAGETAGRAQLFIGAFTAFRNRRAHREVEDSDADLLSEFLAVNQLFRLEKKATETAAPKDEASGSESAKPNEGH